MSIIERINNNTWEQLLGIHVDATAALHSLRLSVNSNQNEVEKALQEFEEKEGHNCDVAKLSEGDLMRLQGIWDAEEVAAFVQAKRNSFARMARQLLKDANP